MNANKINKHLDKCSNNDKRGITSGKPISGDTTELELESIIKKIGNCLEIDDISTAWNEIKDRNINLLTEMLKREDGKTLLTKLLGNLWKYRESENIMDSAANLIANIYLHEEGEQLIFNLIKENIEKYEKASSMDKGIEIWQALKTIINGVTKAILKNKEKSKLFKTQKGYELLYDLHNIFRWEASGRASVFSLALVTGYQKNIIKFIKKLSNAEELCLGPANKKRSLDDIYTDFRFYSKLIGEITMIGEALNFLPTDILPLLVTNEEELNLIKKIANYGKELKNNTLPNLECELWKKYDMEKIEDYLKWLKILESPYCPDDLKEEAKRRTATPPEDYIKMKEDGYDVEKEASLYSYIKEVIKPNLKRRAKYWREVYNRLREISS